MDSYDLAQFCAYVRILCFSTENTYCIHIYNENKSYYDLFRFAFRDFYITVVLLLYISFMITKFFGIHILYNQNTSNYNKEDVFIIII